MAEIFNTNLSNIPCASIWQFRVSEAITSLKPQSNENLYFSVLSLITKSFKKILIHFIGFESDDRWKEEEMMASCNESGIITCTLIRYITTHTPGGKVHNLKTQ